MNSFAPISRRLSFGVGLAAEHSAGSFLGSPQNLQEKVSSAGNIRGAIRPLLTIRGVVGVLGCSPDRILALIEDGELLWAFNVGSPASRAKELRVLPQCVVDWNDARPCTVESTQIFGLVFPNIEKIRLSNSSHCGTFLPEGHTISVAELGLGLNCSSDQVYSFIRAGELAAEGHCRRGCAGSARILCSQVNGFLNSRRWP